MFPSSRRDHLLYLLLQGNLSETTLPGLYLPYPTVWICAEEVYPGSRFIDYPGWRCDSFSIWASAGETWSNYFTYSKSLISSTGAFEFAKRFRVKGGTVDLSPVSLSALKNFYHPYGLMTIADGYSVRRFSTVARIGGASYRQLAKPDSPDTVLVW